MKNNKGVSLAELSVVLAIVGLLLAAIVGGIGIKKSAEIRGFITDIGSFQVSVEGFDAKFSDLPGDMSDAYSHWSTSCANSGVVITDTARCNGDSNGQITRNESDGLDSESYRAWQHLVLSEFMGGGYSGTATTNSIQADIGVNVPASKRTAVGYSIVYANTGDGSRNEITLGKFSDSNINSNSALAPSEAFAIDQKMDDGKPSTGVVHGLDGSDATATNCVSSSSYNTTITSFSCIQTFAAKP